MTIEDRCLRVILVRQLRVHKLARPLMDFETVVFEVDTERSQSICDSTVGPATEYATCVWTEGNDIAE